MNQNTGMLAAFWSSSAAYRTTYGTHPGGSQAYANADEDGLPEFGCHRGVSRETAIAELLVDNRGGHPREQVRNGITSTVGVIGGVVNDLALEAKSGSVGLLFC